MTELSGLVVRRRAAGIEKGNLVALAQERISQDTLYQRLSNADRKLVAPEIADGKAHSTAAVKAPFKARNAAKTPTVPVDAKKVAVVEQRPDTVRGTSRDTNIKPGMA